MALWGGAASHLFFPPGLSSILFYHFTAGQFDQAGSPIDLTYTWADHFVEVLRAASPYQGAKEEFEREQISCGEVDLPYDDHLEGVTIPVLYIGAEGGFGSFGLHSTTLLGSRDVTTRVVSFLPRPVDFGHADLFLAEEARAEVWSLIYQWIRAR